MLQARARASVILQALVMLLASHRSVVRANYRDALGKMSGVFLTGQRAGLKAGKSDQTVGLASSVPTLTSRLPSC